MDRADYQADRELHLARERLRLVLVARYGPNGYWPLLMNTLKIPRGQAYLEQLDREQIEQVIAALDPAQTT